MCASITVVPSPVTEAETKSGLIVPMHAEQSQDPVLRGVVDDVGPGSFCEAWETLRQGLVVYYRNPIPIGDVHLVMHDSILAYEEEDESRERS